MSKRKQTIQRDDIISIEDIKTLYRKNEFVYSILTVITCILIPIYIYISQKDIVEFIRQNQELPVLLICYIFLVEIVKLSLIINLYSPPARTSFHNTRRKTPFTNRISLELGYETDDEDENSYQAEECYFDEVPKLDGVKVISKINGPYWTKVFRYLVEERLPTRVANVEENNSRCSKILKLIKSVLTFVFAVGICHVLLVLFGAPVLTDHLLTFGFSFILVTWLFLPLCIHLRPTTVLYEIIFMCIWNDEIEWVWRSRSRFIVTLVGPWIGALAFPLDWDRPWQRWPIPCLVAAFIAYFIYHCFSILHMAYLLYEHSIKRFLGFQSLNKIKIY